MRPVISKQPRRPCFLGPGDPTGRRPHARARSVAELGPSETRAGVQPGRADAHMRGFFHAPTGRGGGDLGDPARDVGGGPRVVLRGFTSGRDRLSLHDAATLGGASTRVPFRTRYRLSSSALQTMTGKVQTSRASHHRDLLYARARQPRSYRPTKELSTYKGAIDLQNQRYVLALITCQGPRAGW
jgi:hypothetical protein